MNEISQQFNIEKDSADKIQSYELITIYNILASRVYGTNKT